MQRGHLRTRCEHDGPRFLGCLSQRTLASDGLAARRALRVWRRGAGARPANASVPRLVQGLECVVVPISIPLPSPIEPPRAAVPLGAAAELYLAFQHQTDTLGIAGDGEGRRGEGAGRRAAGIVVWQAGGGPPQRVLARREYGASSPAPALRCCARATRRKRAGDQRTFGVFDKILSSGGLLPPRPRDHLAHGIRARIL